MNPILKKLHIGSIDPVLIMNAPDEFLEMVKPLNVEIHEEIADYYNYVQVFAHDTEEAQDLIQDALSALETGGYFWFCFPKETSPELETDIDYDALNELIDSFDLEGVTQVPIDENWMAIRLKFADDLEDDDELVSGEKLKKRFHNSED
ncbi:MAG: hypothetical protein M0P66_11975 [Salinivirgaceae bacterium]|nr:hypothetical protein [Salinivirgaceae bacterium]